MKDKPKTATEAVIATVGAQITDTDRNVLDNARLKSELALERVKTALSQKETADISYNNMVLTLAVKYRLTEGDVIEIDGTIQRNS